MSAHPQTVLLIEDDPEDAGLVTDLLTAVEPPTFRVERTEQLSQGLARLGKGGIAAVLLDLALPDSQGLATLETVHKYAPGLPILILTGPQDDTFAAKCIEQGAQDHLIKGEIDGRLLKKALRYVIDLKESQQEIERSREQLRKLAAHLQTAREQEREAIAREMHDEVGQPLSALKIDLALFSRRMEEGKPPSSAAVDDLSLHSMAGLIDQTIQAVRNLLTDLRPELLAELGLRAALEAHVERFRAQTGLGCELVWRAGRLDLDEPRALAIYRIVQESLNNIARHSGADRSRVEVQQSATGILVTVTDNGRGVEETEIEGDRAFGIIGMRERALVLGAQLEIRGEAGRGTMVKLHIPLAIGRR